jgi:PIN domain nuclease of toxin-antitoxin system
MTPYRKAICAVSFILLTSNAAVSAPVCSNYTLRSLQTKLATFNSTWRACNRALSKSRVDYDKMCSACRTPLRAMDSVIRISLANKSCLGMSRRLLADLKTAKDATRFLRRGCGFN